MERRDHKFALWLARALFSGAGVLVAVLVSAAQVWPKVKSFDERLWARGLAFMTVPQFWAIAAVVVGLWLLYLWRTWPRGDSHHPPKPDIPLHQAVRYIARDSVWAAARDPKDDDDWPLTVDYTFLSAVECGRITAFGRRREPGRSTSPATTPIPKQELAGVAWDCHLMASEKPPITFRLVNGVRYARVMFDRREIEKEWPKRSLWARLRRRSPIERLGGKGYGGLFSKQDEAYNLTPETANLIDLG